MIIIIVGVISHFLFMPITNLEPVFQIYVYVVAFILGSVMGSFLNCWAYRICHNMKITEGRSTCDYCGHVLGFKDLVPVFSYIFSKGKCRYCGHKLNLRYVISEIVGGTCYVLVVWKFGLTLETIEYLILVSLMMVVSFADIEDMIIPNRFIVIGIINRLIFVFLGGNIKSDLISCLIGSVCISVPVFLLSIVMDKILKRETMGGGDIKLFFMLGMYFTVPENILGLLFACTIGLIYGALIRKTKEPFPFGPSICVGYFITLMVGSYFLNWYVSLF